MSTRRGAAAVAALAVGAGAYRHAAGARARRTWSAPGGRAVDVPLAARVVGDGEPAVLLLHGMFNAGRYWGAAYDELAEPGALVVPDLLGFGRSPRPPGGYTAAEHAGTVAALLDELGTTAPLVVGAHSVGSVVALRLAIQRPDLVAAVVAFAPPLYSSPESARAQIASIDPLAKLFLASPELGERACALMCRHPAAAAALVRVAKPALPAPLAKDRVEHSWASYSETLANLVVTAEAPDWLGAVQAPVHLVAGTGDTAVDLSFLEVLASRHDHVSLEIVDGAGHDLPLMHTGRCLDVLQRTRRASAPTASDPAPGGA